MPKLTGKIRSYWPLIKSLQTGLLVTTGLAGYMSARCPVFHLGTLAGLLVSLFLSISGSTILNMWWDRDIDAKMKRTQKRPLASGQISPDEALRLGLLLALLGVGSAPSQGQSLYEINSTSAETAEIGHLGTVVDSLAFRSVPEPSTSCLLSLAGLFLGRWTVRPRRGRDGGQDASRVSHLPHRRELRTAVSR